MPQVHSPGGQTLSQAGERPVDQSVTPGSTGRGGEREAGRGGSLTGCTESQLCRARRLGALGSGVARAAEVSSLQYGSWGVYTPFRVRYWLRAAPEALLPAPPASACGPSPLLGPRTGRVSGACSQEPPRPGAESLQGRCGPGAEHGAADRGAGPCSCGPPLQAGGFPLDLCQRENTSCLSHCWVFCYSQT